jgi:threonine dehydratase
VAWAARRFGHEAHIFVPTTANPAKVARLRDYGAKVRQIGGVYSEALAAAQQFLAARMATSIHAYDDPVVMTGAGTCARELDRAAPHLDAVVMACGGGGLSGSTAAWYGDRAEIVVVETTGTATYAAALEHGGPVDIDVSGVATDALGATRLGAHPWAALSDVGATSVLVSDDHVLAARELLWKWLRIVVEPAAAAPIAALTTGAWRPAAASDRVGVVICGANTTLDVDAAVAR